MSYVDAGPQEDADHNISEPLVFHHWFFAGWCLFVFGHTDCIDALSRAFSSWDYTQFSGNFPAPPFFLFLLSPDSDASFLSFSNFAAESLDFSFLHTLPQIHTGFTFLSHWQIHDAGPF